jgi:hypothetical protein
MQKTSVRFPKHFSAGCKSSTLRIVNRLECGLNVCLEKHHHDLPFKLEKRIPLRLLSLEILKLQWEGAKRRLW